MDIEQKLQQLPLTEQEKFQKRLMNVLYDRLWFTLHRMDYADPNVPIVKEILFREEYEGYIPKFS